MAKTKKEKPLNPPSPLLVTPEIQDKQEVPEIVIDYDGLWKLIIEAFFFEFTAFFLPKLFKDIDLSYPPEFLDQELLTIHKELKVPKQVVDKLIKVKLKDGSIKWVLIHVEVQARFEIDFSTRMFLYKAFIFAKYQLPIVALAIYPVGRTPKNFDSYEESFYDTTVMYRFNAYKIAKQKEADLIQSDNIFALFVLAHLYVIKTTPKLYNKRVAFKEKLFELAREKDIPKAKIDRMLIFVDQVLALPIHLQTTFMENVVNKKSGRKRLPIEDKLEQSHKEFFKAFFTAQMGVEPDVYFAQQKAALDQAVKEAAARTEAAARKQAENEKLINQIYVAIQMHRQLDLEVAKVALVMNMPLDEIRLIFKYEQQKNITAELLLPIFQQYRDAKQANPKIDPMTWEYMERPQ
ncbi:MAG: hypothetical protein RLZZ628_3878 [Bacteroidota bacterium]|jgi:hypothetical protein